MEYSGILLLNGIFLFIYLFIYSANMCWSDQGPIGVWVFWPMLYGGYLILLLTLVLVLLDFQKQRIAGYDFLEKDQIQRTASPGHF